MYEIIGDGTADPCKGSKSYSDRCNILVWEK
jgi:hypothetical protein